MITWICTANTIPGKIGEAVVWSKGVSAAVKRVTGKDLAVATAFGGPAGGLSWMMQKCITGRRGQRKTDG